MIIVILNFLLVQPTAQNPKTFTPMNDKEHVTFLHKKPEPVEIWQFWWKKWLKQLIKSVIVAALVHMQIKNITQKISFSTESWWNL